MNYPDKIEVLIPKQLFFHRKYNSKSKCYLAEALKKLGYSNFEVDECDIFGDPENKTFLIFEKGWQTEALYVTKLPFNIHTVREAFGWGKNIPVTLIKQK